MNALFSFVVLMGIFWGAGSAVAQSSAQSPVDISASGSLEWQRDAKAYVAKGDVIVKQDGIELFCDTLTASYSDGRTITLITAEGNVRIRRPPHEAFGDRAVYDVPKGLFILTGQGLRLVTPEEKLTARDRIEYSSPQNRLDAYGSASIFKGGDSLTAGHLTAFFDGIGDTDPTKGLELREVQAENDVVITTPKETIYGHSGSWNARSQKALLKGPVRILQGTNTLEGDHVTVDMKTGLSQLFAASGEGGAGEQGRVRGVFYPKAKEANDEEKNNSTPRP